MAKTTSDLKTARPVSYPGQKRYTKKVKAGEGKIRVFRRKAIQRIFEDAHTELQKVLDLMSNGGTTFDTPKMAPNFNGAKWETAARKLLHDLETVGRELDN